MSVLEETRRMLEHEALSSIIAYAQKAYPNECCGFVLENALVIPGHNVIATLNEPTLTPANAFLIDATSWQTAVSQKHPIICIYHSHTNGDPEMSEMDQHTLTIDGIYYLVLGLQDSHPVAAKLHWWNDGILNNATIIIQKEANIEDTNDQQHQSSLPLPTK